MRIARFLLPTLAFGLLGGPTMANDGFAPRQSEPIVLTDLHLSPLLGQATEALALRAWRGTDWSTVAFQVDEFSPQGIVARTGDGRLDRPDVLVFMADALGEAAPAGAWPADVPASATTLLVSVSDPLREGWMGFAYLYASDTALPAGEPAPPLVLFDRQSGELRSVRYTLGVARDAADGFVGLKRLSLFGSEVDLLDRSKLRADLRVSGHPYPLTEETLEFHSAWDIPDQLRRTGPVRIVLDDMARGVAYEGRIEVDIDLGGVQLPPEFGLSSVRASLDLSADAIPARYLDANVPQGVAIDGQPDVVPTAPTSRWREIDVADGRLVFLTDAEMPEGARLYYRDDARPDANDTGDGRSYGDNGVLIPDLEAAAATGLRFTLVVLAHGQDVSAEQLLAHADHPLVVSVELAGPWPSPTPSPATPTPTASSEPTALDTPGPSGHRCYLPAAAS